LIIARQWCFGAAVRKPVANATVAMAAILAPTEAPDTGRILIVHREIGFLRIILMRLVCCHHAGVPRIKRLNQKVNHAGVIGSNNVCRKASF